MSLSESRVGRVLHALPLKTARLYMDFIRQNFRGTTISGSSSLAASSAGIVTLTHSSLAGAGYIAAKPFSGYIPFFSYDLATYNWYVSGTFNVDVAPVDATRVAGVGIIDAANVINIVGVNGSASTTKYCCTIGAATALSTVSITSGSPLHLFELWRTPTGAYFSVDNESPIACPTIASTGTSHLCGYSSIGGTPSGAVVSYFGSAFGITQQPFSVTLP